MPANWDIFCTVVDNYGDIGVTWRLARQLVSEHGLAVRLWVDDLRAFERLCPELDIEQEQQVREGVEVRRWSGDWQPVAAADVVIGAFACQLPHDYMDAMARRETTPLWLNLDYLSAEDWIVGCHGLPSVKYKQVQKFFFFPGFEAGTGGLLREAGLLEQRRVFQADPAARRDFLRGLGVDPTDGERLISLFAYENESVASWLEALAADSRPTRLLVPEGRVLADVQRWLGSGELRAGAIETRRALTVQVLPFVPQQAYDRLLWSCDFNAVRGEDSFIRAQWAGRPLLWHIYRQEDDIHLDKLEAFLALYTRGLSEPALAAFSGWWRAWNSGKGVGESWSAVLHNERELAEHAERWCLEQASRPDLATALVKLYLNWI
ncbi:elongation factor P maturation arginine rhamnosyltransferase EarP [Pseudomonas gingeri]|uniref:elongation factor P maturation arginine rhamnosyltransferase EarP n=1 Tax=Pseudomonas gingeri TaxID=117681 RepID=UPI0015A1A58E|nr:elongation factor P maturation arginine rhamnosyltransferase EarP [Pseudomonas gingeri]NVZ60457.1 elongation factor P maturation arginine rhamnosyltransferase EarP [Pseudomonas gingeri]NVZ74218.1 elongation factor P maturation arginine rhamnosyltransferase EarP [Pseudomonas gingeri]